MQQTINPNNVIVFGSASVVINLLFLALAVRGELKGKTPQEILQQQTPRCVSAFLGLLVACYAYAYAPLLFAIHPPIAIEFGRWVIGLATGAIVTCSALYLFHLGGYFKELLRRSFLR
ncbi:MAG: hypothetical protein AAB507_01120 [Patescibacteria group bacterium]